MAIRQNRTYRSAALFRAHDEREAQRLLDGGLKAAGLSPKKLPSLPGSDARDLIGAFIVTILIWLTSALTR